MNRFEETLRGLDYCIEHASRPEGITLGEVMDHLAFAGFCFVSLLLATPFIQPVSLGPLVMASGGVFMLVGWQMAHDSQHVNLPPKVRAWVLKGGWVRVLKWCRKLLLWMSKFTRPRFSNSVDGARGTRNVGWLIFTGGLLLAVPCANLPFNNTLPALMIFFAALAWLERDGLMAIFSVVWGILTLVYFAGAAILIFWVGSSAWQWVGDWFKSG